MTTRMSDDTRQRIAAAWPDIIGALANGAQVNVTLTKHGVSAPTARLYRLENPLAQSEWDAAREQSADALFDEALSIARDPFVDLGKNDKGEQVIVRRDSAHARTHIVTLKWAARIRNPRLYGDKQQLDVNVRTVDLTRIIQDANARLIHARAAQGITHDGEARRIQDAIGIEALL